MSETRPPWLPPSAPWPSGNWAIPPISLAAAKELARLRPDWYPPDAAHAAPDESEAR